MRIVETITELRAALLPSRQAGKTIGLVPTMGAFHDGHLALMRAAREECDVVVVSLFVNPTQFGAAEDLTAYPRDPERDTGLAAETGVDLLFVPSVDEMYPNGFQTWVEVEEVARGMEGAARPGHFRGVATICLKLFLAATPDRAYFGEKDAQQAAVVKQLVRDLALPLELRLVPTVRDADGLALSSRNRHLTAEERRAALVLPRALAAGKAAHEQGANADAVTRTLLVGARRQGVEIDYVETARLNGRLVLAAAVRVGGTRLIDNVLLEGDLS
jgi:pantoate--beta-alanine ligase